MEKRKIELTNVRIIEEWSENVDIGEYLLKNHSDTVKQAGTIYDNQQNILGYILLLHSKDLVGTELTLMNANGKINPMGILGLFEKFEFKKDKTKVFIRFKHYMRRQYVFTIYDEKNNRCDFATAKISTIFNMFDEICDVPNTPFVLVHTSMYDRSYDKDSLTWNIFSVDENRFVINCFLDFKPKIILTEKEIHLYLWAHGRNICLYIYDWNYNCILTTFAESIQNVCPGAWIGKHPLSEDRFLTCRNNLIMRTTNEFGKCENKGHFVLDKDNQLLYDVWNNKIFRVTTIIDENTEFEVSFDLAIIYNKKNRRFSAYAKGDTLVKNMRYRGKNSEIDVKKIKYSSWYVFLSDGKKYLRTMGFKQFLCNIKDILRG